MFEFCPHCGGSIDQEQVAGQVVDCQHCGKHIGVVAAPAPTVVVDQAEELIQAGTAARCPLCQQLVALKVRDGARSFVPHRGAGKQALCPTSGKPSTAAADAARRTVGGKDLSAFIKEAVRVISCRPTGNPSIEELLLEYLDKADRVRIQIEALREMLGPEFRMADYPRVLGRTHLAIWASAATCVVGKRHGQGGVESMTDAEIAAVLNDLAQHRALFFA
jgi:DNA-directed RNA polymerase subunit RPC12/RpoP